jgi:hypothetical protein
MPYRMKTTTLSLPYRLGNVSCFLMETGAGFALIDPEGSQRRADLVGELERTYCPVIAPWRGLCERPLRGEQR